MMKSIGLLTVAVVALATAAYLPAGDRASDSKAEGGCGSCSASTTGLSTETCNMAEVASGCCSKETSASEQGCSEGCPSTKFTSQGDVSACAAGKCSGEACTKTTSAKTTSAEGCSTCTATKAACEGCPSTKMTSKGEAESCCGKCSGEACTKATSAEKCTTCPAGKECSKCTAGEKCSTCTATKAACEGCPHTKMTSKGEAESCCGKCSGEACTKTTSAEKCTTCPAGKECSKCSEGECCGACKQSKTVATSAQTSEGATCTGSCGGDCSTCPITAAMAKLPQMTYMVGDQQVCCPDAASELAKQAGKDIRYAVGEKSFAGEDKAKVALVEATEQFVAAFAKPSVCKESGNITVCGQKACCEGSAAAMAKTAKAAMDKVAMTYMVGEKSCNCPVEAEKMAKDSGDVTLFVVGQEKTACQVTARLNLARAKYKAAVVAMMQNASDTTETSASDS